MKKTKNKIVLLPLAFLLVGGFSFWGCGPNERPGPEQPEVICQPESSFLLPHEVQDYMRFDSASYWAYENKETRDIEVVTVIEDGMEISPRYLQVYGAEYCQEGGVNSLHWSNHPNYFSYNVSFWVVPGDNQGDSANYFSYCYTSIVLKEGNETSSFGYNRFSIRGSKWNDNQYGSIVTKQDSLVVGDLTYRDILKLDYPNYKGEDEFRQAYWARHIGLVKFVTRDGFEWNCVYHEVSQDY